MRNLSPPNSIMCCPLFPPDTIAHLLKSLLTSASFTALQEALTDMYEKTKHELFERLIRKSKLTGRPSLFLAELREMGDKVGVGDELIRHKFIQTGGCSRRLLDGG